MFIRPVKLRLCKVSEKAHAGIVLLDRSSVYSSVVAKVFTDVLGSDLWEETKQSDQTLLSPVLLLEGATESFIICVQTVYNRVKIQMRCNHPTVWCFSV